MQTTRKSLHGLISASLAALAISNKISAAATTVSSSTQVPTSHTITAPAELRRRDVTPGVTVESIDTYVEGTFSYVTTIGSVCGFVTSDIRKSADHAASTVLSLPRLADTLQRRGVLLHKC